MSRASIQNKLHSRAGVHIVNNLLEHGYCSPDLIPALRVIPTQTYYIDDFDFWSRNRDRFCDFLFVSLLIILRGVHFGYLSHPIARRQTFRAQEIPRS